MTLTVGQVDLTLQLRVIVADENNCRDLGFDVTPRIKLTTYIITFLIPFRKLLHTQLFIYLLVLGK